MTLPWTGELSTLPKRNYFKQIQPDSISTQHRGATQQLQMMRAAIKMLLLFSQLQHSPSRLLSTADGKSLTSSGRPLSTCSGTSSKVSTATGDSLVFYKSKSQPQLTGKNNYTTGDQPTPTSKLSDL